MLKLILAKPVEEVGLVLVGIDGAGEMRRTVRVDDAPGVVAGRHGLAVVQVSGASKERSELDVSVAVHAWTRRPAVEIGVEERLQDPGIELALEIHDVEGNAKLSGNAACIVGCVERAAALLELGVRVGDVVESHPYPDGLVTGPGNESGGDGRIHAP